MPPLKTLDKSPGSAGFDDGEVAEVVAEVVLTLFTNYFNHVNQTEVDFPKVPVDMA